MKKYFDEALYEKIGVKGLILFCIDSVISEKQACGFEKLLQECFKYFPRIFGFRQNRKWPDSRKLDRPLRLLRQRKLVLETSQGDFLLTGQGEKEVEEIAKSFKQSKLKI